MTRVRAVFLVLAFVMLLAAYSPAGTDKSKDEIDRFNQELIQLHLRMDQAGIMALWADDGVDLMQGEAPIVGKPAITAWLDNALANLKGYKVTKQEMEFHDIRCSGEWASEWATAHQTVQPPDGKPPIESYGKIALVFHREGGEWKIMQEMWNSAPRTDAQPKQ